MKTPQNWPTKRSTIRGLFRIWVVLTALYLVFQTVNFRNEIKLSLKYGTLDHEVIIHKKIELCKEMTYAAELSLNAQSNPEKTKQHIEKECKKIINSISDYYDVSKWLSIMLIPPILVPIGIAIATLIIWILYLAFKWAYRGFKD